MEAKAECFAMNELRQLLIHTPDKVILIDARTFDEYVNMPLPRPINLPLYELPSRLNALPKEKQIITVCGKGGGRSAQAALFLVQIGFEKSAGLCRGAKERFSL